MAGWSDITLPVSLPSIIHWAALVICSGSTPIHKVLIQRPSIWSRDGGLLFQHEPKPSSSPFTRQGGGKDTSHTWQGWESLWIEHHRLWGSWSSAVGQLGEFTLRLCHLGHHTGEIPTASSDSDFSEVSKLLLIVRFQTERSNWFTVSLLALRAFLLLNLRGAETFIY